MEFFCYRDRPGSALREELLEEHWSIWDRYAAQMIARGPTSPATASPRQRAHRRLPHSTAARAFAFDEPGYQPVCTGMCCCAVLTRWAAPWDFAGADGGHRYLVLGLGTGQAADIAVPRGRDDLNRVRAMLLDQRPGQAGTAVLVRRRTQGRRVLTGRYGLCFEVHNWQMAGGHLSRPAFTTGHSTRTALTTLQTAVRGVSSGSNSAAEVRTAVHGVTTATANLGTAFAQGGCIAGD
jgi:hypothetical protein